MGLFRRMLRIVALIVFIMMICSALFLFVYLASTNHLDQNFLATLGIEILAFLLIIGGLLYLRIRYPIPFYTALIKIAPRHFLFYNNRGTAYSQRGDYTHALQDYEQAIALKPQNAFPYNSRGTTYLSRRRYQDALQDFERAIQLNPSFAQAYLNRGTTYVNLKRYEQAIQDFSQAIALHAGLASAYAYVGRGTAYTNLRQFQQALEDCSDASQLAPRFPEIYNTRGTIYSKQGDYARSVQEYSHAIELSTNALVLHSGHESVGVPVALTYVNRSIAFIRLKDYQAALQDATSAIELAPQLAITHYRKGIVSLHLNNLQQATAEIACCLAMDSQQPLYALLKVWLEMCTTAPTIAMAERLEAAASIDQTEGAAYACRGVAFWIRDDYTRALRELEQGTHHEPDEWTLHCWIGIVLATLDRDVEAINAIRYALALGLPPILMQLLQRFKQQRPEFYTEYISPLRAERT